MDRIRGIHNKIGENNQTTKGLHANNRVEIGEGGGGGEEVRSR